MRRKIAVPVPVGLIVLLALALLLLLPASAQAGDIIHVDAVTGDDLTGDGTPSKPYESISQGLCMASAGDVIFVANGDYYPTSTLHLTPGVRISGQAPAHETVVHGNGTFSVFSITDAGSDTVIEGLTIRDGGGVDGGAIKIIGGAAPDWGPTIQRIGFVSNDVTGNGGAIHITKGAATACKPTIRHNFFISNTADGHGGSIWAFDVILDISDNRFMLGDAGAGNGGGIYAGSSGGTIQRCEFSGCTATSFGGGLMAENVTGVLTVTDSVFYQCEADFGGGIYAVGSSLLHVRNSAFHENTAVTRGGAMRLNETDAQVLGCTINGNQAPTTGGIAVYDLSQNDPLTLTSSILWDNGGDDVTDDLDSFCDLDCTYTLLQEIEAGTGNITGTDPLFVWSAIWPKDLQSGSPAIDMGDPASPLTSDYDQHDRPVDGDGDGDARVDMGAFEYGSTIGRLAGTDRFSTSAACVDDRYFESGMAILATGRDYPDALCAAGLAGMYDAPVLLTDTNSLPTSVRDKLVDLQTREVYIVGGTGVVGPGVVSELEAMGIIVNRLSGSDRYATSRAVAEHVGEYGLTSLCYIARGDMFPDALSLAPLAAGMKGPVILTRPDSLPAPSLAALAAYPWGKALVAGGTGAVSQTVFDAIEAEIGVGFVDRAAGATRYDTAASVARYARDAGYGREDFIGLAVGNNFPDALAGGAACGYEGGLLLLTTTDSLHPAAAGFLADDPDELHEIYAFGGTGVIADRVLTDCAAIAP